MTKHVALLVALALAGACAAPPTTGTTAEEIVVSPLAYDFGSIAVGDTATPRNVFVSPSSTGFEDDYIDSIDAPCGDFSLDLSTLDNPAEVYRICNSNQANGLFLLCPGGTIEIQSQYFAVSFHPSFAGQQSCPITIHMQNAGPRLITMTGTGTAPPVALTLVNPAGGDVAFGDVVVGSQSAALPVTIRSDGTGPLDLTDASISGPDAAAFTLDSMDSEPIAQGDTYSWQITCTPPGPGPLSATLTISSNAPDSPSTVAISCNGIQSNLTVSPSPVQFTETLIGNSVQQSVDLGNSGTALLTIMSTQIVSGPFTAPDLAGTDIDPLGMAVTLPITFTPTAADAGTDVRGSLLITFNGGADSRTIDLVGPARDAALSLTPAGAVDFGTVCAGQTREQLFVALNTGSGAARLDRVELSGAGFRLDLISPASLPALLPAQGASSASFRVTAMPATGEATGELTVGADIPGAAPTVVPLHAVGVDGGVGASPLAIDFGAVVVDQPSGGQTVRISNCDPAALALTSATITGPDARDFVLVAVDQQVPGTLASTASAVFAIDLRPSSTGDKTAAFELVHGDGTTVIPLTGIGVGDPTPGGGGDRGSYYACSAGGRGAGFGLAPIAGALALLLRRRRRA